MAAVERKVAADPNRRNQSTPEDVCPLTECVAARLRPLLKPLSEGQSNQEIAEELSLAVHTVRTMSLNCSPSSIARLGSGWQFTLVYARHYMQVRSRLPSIPSREPLRCLGKEVSTIVNSDKRGCRSTTTRAVVSRRIALPNLEHL